VSLRQDREDKALEKNQRMDLDTMNKALTMGKVSATGSFHLWIGMVISNVIAALGTVVLARLMLPAEYGLYTMALTPPLLIGLFRDLGMNFATAKYVAQHVAQGKAAEVRKVIVANLFFELASGVVLLIVSVLLAGFIASAFFKRPELAPLIVLASITIFAGSLLTVSESSFTGFERMDLKSITMTYQAVVKALVSPLLVILGYGALGAVLGYTLAFLVTSILGLAMLYSILFRNLRKSLAGSHHVFRTFKYMLRYGLPLSVSDIIGGTAGHTPGFLPLFYNFLLAFYCTDVVVGNYRAATNFTVLLTPFTFPIVTVLFPTFVKVDSQNEQKLLQTVFRASVKYSALIVVPVATGIVILSEPLVFTLLGQRYELAPFFLSFSILGFLYAGFGSLCISSFLAGLGETKTLMKLGILTLMTGMPLSVVLVPYLGVFGVIVANLVSTLFSLIYGLRYAWKHYKVSVDWSSTVKIFMASGVAGAITYISAPTLSLLVTAEWAGLVVGGAIFVVIYMIMIPLLGAVNTVDVDNLRKITSDMVFVSKLSSLPLSAIEKLLSIKQNKRL